HVVLALELQATFEPRQGALARMPLHGNPPPPLLGRHHYPSSARQLIHGETEDHLAALRAPCGAAVTHHHLTAVGVDAHARKQPVRLAVFAWPLSSPSTLPSGR